MTAYRRLGLSVPPLHTTVGRASAFAWALALLLSPGEPALATPGDRVERYPPQVCIDCGSVMAPATAADTAGNSLVVWVKDDSDLAKLGLWARWFRPDGIPRGNPFRISPQQTSLDGSPDAPSVAMRPDGAFVVTWVARGLRTPDLVRARLFDSDGAPRSGLITVSSAGHEPQYDQMAPPQVAMDHDGDFVIVWASVNPTSGNWTAWTRLYDSAGAPRGLEFSVDPTGPSPRRRIPDVAMDAAGNFVVVWWQSDFADGTMTVLGRRFDASGAARGDRFAIPAPAVSGDPGSPVVAMDDAGRFAVAFVRNLTELDSSTVSIGVFGRQFDASGNPVGGEFRASALGRAPYRGELDIDMDNDGDFVVGWVGQEGDSGTRLHTRLFRSSGKPLTPDRSYGFGRVGARFERLAMDAVGNFTATWVANDFSKVSVQHFAGPDDNRPGCSAYIAGIVGTSGSETLQGTSGDDVITGLGGQDVLYGRDGDDIICGGPGDDQLFGESDRDRLLGGPGDDVLDGGDGRDTCNGNRHTNADTALACEAVLQVP